MSATVQLILMIAALVLFILDAVGVPSAPRFRLLSAGLACWVAAVIFGPMLR